jgi:hypothetical protein
MGVILFYSLLSKLFGCWCLMTVILASQEAEIRRFAVQSQPEEIY